MRVGSANGALVDTDEIPAEVGKKAPSPAGWTGRHPPFKTVRATLNTMNTVLVPMMLAPCFHALMECFIDLVEK
jgi:hypothetical protein